MDKVRENIKNRIYPLMWSKGIKLKDLSEKTQIRYDMLCDKINGKRLINNEDLEKISNILQININITGEKIVVTGEKNRKH